MNFNPNFKTSWQRRSKSKDIQGLIFCSVTIVFSIDKDDENGCKESPAEQELRLKRKKLEKALNAVLRKPLPKPQSNNMLAKSKTTEKEELLPDTGNEIRQKLALQKKPMECEFDVMLFRILLEGVPKKSSNDRHCFIAISRFIRFKFFLYSVEATLQEAKVSEIKISESSCCCCCYILFLSLLFLYWRNKIFRSLL